MDKFQQALMYRRLEDFNSILTEDELEIYCEYSVYLAENEINTFDYIDKLLQCRVLYARKEYTKELMNHCCSSLTDTEIYGGNYLWTTL